MPHPEVGGLGQMGDEQHPSQRAPVETILPEPEGLPRQEPALPWVQLSEGAEQTGVTENILFEAGVPSPSPIDPPSRKFPRRPDFERWPEFGFPPLVGGMGNSVDEDKWPMDPNEWTEEVYKRWVREVSPFLPDWAITELARFIKRQDEKDRKPAEWKKKKK